MFQLINNKRSHRSLFCDTFRNENDVIIQSMQEKSEVLFNSTQKGTWEHLLSNLSDFYCM